MKRARTISHAQYAATSELIVRSYNELVERITNGTATPEEVKEFATRHTAARAALAHLDHLKKLAGPDEEAASAAREALLTQARDAIGGSAEAADDADE